MISHIWKIGRAYRNNGKTLGKAISLHKNIVAQLEEVIEKVKKIDPQSDPLEQLKKACEAYQTKCAVELGILEGIGKQTKLQRLKNALEHADVITKRWEKVNDWEEKLQQTHIKISLIKQDAATEQKADDLAKDVSEIRKEFLIQLNQLQVTATGSASRKITSSAFVTWFTLPSDLRTLWKAGGSCEGCSLRKHLSLSTAADSYKDDPLDMSVYKVLNDGVRFRFAVKRSSSEYSVLRLVPKSEVDAENVEINMQLSSRYSNCCNDCLIKYHRDECRILANLSGGRHVITLKKQCRFEDLRTQLANAVEISGGRVEADELRASKNIWTVVSRFSCWFENRRTHFFLQIEDGWDKNMNTADDCLKLMKRLEDGCVGTKVFNERVTTSGNTTSKITSDQRFKAKSLLAESGGVGNSHIRALFDRNCENSVYEKHSATDSGKFEDLIHREMANVFNKGILF